LRAWLPPQLVILWREQHPAAPFQLQFPLAHVGGAAKQLTPVWLSWTPE
jgi:hypothetical protein